MKKEFVCFCAIASLLIPSSVSFAKTSEPRLQKEDYYTPIHPDKDSLSTSISVVRQLSNQHYRKFKLDDTLSAKLLDRYIDNLDPAKSYFLSSDIQRFEKYKDKLDDSLKAGELESAYEIYNKYQLRIIENLVFLINTLQNGVQNIDLTKEEVLEIDRKDAKWSATKSELTDLWKKRLKNSLLNLKMTDKSLEEAAETLVKRYKNQLNRTGQVNSEDVFQTYINSFSQIYDPHTQYFSPRKSENFNIHMSLSLEGIGAVLQSDNEYTKVIRLVPAGPADKGKQLKPADKIVSVGQGEAGEMVDVLGWRLDEVVQLIRGPKGTIVRLDVIPVDAEDLHETKRISIVRNTVKLEEQSAQKKIIELTQNNKKHKIGVIEIPTFYLDFRAYQAGELDYKSTTRDVTRLLNELQKENVSGIIIDLRNNGGGSLQEASAMTGLFIKYGPTVQVRHANGQVNILYDPDPSIVYKGPLIVLINRLSASASEIFAGAIQDYHRGIIIGEQTFGKGTVQSLVSLDRGQLKTTIAKFYRVSGDSTQHRGVIPDITYPGIFDKDEIGESSLLDALEWDKIEPTSYKEFRGSMADVLEKLQLQHDNRIKENPDYDFLLAKIERQKEIRKKTVISLKEETRKKEQDDLKQWRLTTENKRRKAKNMKLLTDFKQLEEEEKEKAKEQNIAGHKADIEDDFLLTESGYILIDFMSRM